MLNIDLQVAFRAQSGTLSLSQGHSNLKVDTGKYCRQECEVLKPAVAALFFPTVVVDL